MQENHSSQTSQAQLELLQRFATCFVIRWYQIAFVYEMYHNCFHVLRFHSKNRHNSSTGIA